MAKPLFIAEHSCHARGLLGRLISKIMAFDTAAENRRAIELLDTHRARNILDFGCGHGRWIGHLHKLAPNAQICGADSSPVMIREAKARNRRLIQQGIAKIKHTKSAALPFDTGQFDKVLSMHTVYFLHPIEEYLAEFYRITAPGGQIVLGFRPGEDAALVRSLPQEVYRMRETDEIKDLARSAGFAIQNTIQSAAPAKSMVWLKLQKD